MNPQNQRRDVVFFWMRIHHTDYDKYRMQGTEREIACEAVRNKAGHICPEWQGPFDLPEAP